VVIDCEVLQKRRSRCTTRGELRANRRKVGFGFTGRKADSRNLHRTGGEAAMPVEAGAALISPAALPGPAADGAKSDFEDYLLTGHRLSMGFAGSAVISRAAQ
jgi:hypothetical protein